MAIPLLRDQQRQYVADTTEATKLRNRAATLNDMSQIALLPAQVAGAVSKIGSGVKTLRADEINAELDSVNRMAEVAEARAAAENSKLIAEGANPDSEDFLSAYRGRVMKHFEDEFKKSGADIKWKESIDAYKTRRDDYIAQGQAANIRLGAELRQRPVVGGNVSEKARKNFADFGTAYVETMSRYGAENNTIDPTTLTNEFYESLDSKLKDLPPDERRARKLAVLQAGMTGYIVNNLTHPDERARLRADAALESNETFQEYFPEIYVTEMVAAERDAQLAEYNQQLAHARLVRDGLREGSEGYENAEKEIDQITAKIELLEKENKIYSDGTESPVREKSLDVPVLGTITVKKSKKDKDSYIDFDEYATTKIREQMRSELALLSEKALGEKRLAARRAENARLQEQAAIGVIDPYDPSFANRLKMLSIGEQSTKFEWDENGNPKIVEQPGESENMTRVEYDEQGMPHATTEPKKGFYQKWYDDYQGFRSEMSKVSQIAESSFADKRATHIALNELLQIPFQDASGSSEKWDAAAAEFLYKMAQTPLTESERQAYKDTVSQMMLMNSDEFLQMQDLLTSGNLGVYMKRTMKGVERDLTAPRNILGNNGEIVFAEERGLPKKIIRNTQTGEVESVYKVPDAFMDRMERAASRIATETVKAYANGVPYDEIKLMQSREFQAAIDEYYSDRYIVDLKALREKKRNKEPAVERINGVLYEYYADDSFGRPIWRDPGTLNTNRDFARINKSYKMGQQ